VAVRRRVSSASAPREFLCLVFVVCLPWRCSNLITLRP